MRGSCLAGRVSYLVSGKPLGVNYCHCTQCRKASGTAFPTRAPWNPILDDLPRRMAEEDLRF